MKKIKIALARKRRKIASYRPVIFPAYPTPVMAREEYIYLVVHKPGAKLALFVRGSGEVEVCGRIIEAKLSGSLHYVRGSKTGVTVVKIRPRFHILFDVWESE